MRKFNDKKSKAAIVLIFIMSAITAFAGNIVKSPDFKDMRDWNWVDYNAKGNFEFSDNAGVLKISSPEDNHIYLWQDIPVEKDAIYRFSAEIKAENIPDKENGAMLGLYYKLAYSDEVRGTTEDFVPVEMYFTTKHDSVPVMLSLGGYSRMNLGTAYFRNVSVEKVDSVPEGAHYYEYINDEATENGEFDKRWYLLCLLLGVTVAASIIYVYNASEGGSEK